MDPAHISHFESGRRLPSFPNFCAIASVVDTSPEFLMGCAVAEVPAEPAKHGQLYQDWLDAPAHPDPTSVLAAIVDGHMEKMRAELRPRRTIIGEVTRA